MTFLQQLGESIKGTETDWPNIIISAIVSIASSFIGAGAAIYVYKKGTKDQFNREVSRKEEEDISRIIYLKYLIERGIKELESVVEAIDKVLTYKSNNHSSTPAFVHIPLVCTKRITSKISQEDYFLSLTSQIKTLEPHGIFLEFDSAWSIVDLLLSNLKEQYSESQNKGNDLQDSADRFYGSLSRLVKNIDSYNLNISENEKLAFSSLLETVNSVSNDVNIDHYISKGIQPLIETLLIHSHSKEVNNIFEEAQRIAIQYKSLQRLNERKIFIMINYKANLKNSITVILDSLSKIEVFLKHK